MNLKNNSLINIMSACNLITIQNSKICDFYKKYPAISIENVNGMFIDLFEKILENRSDKDVSSYSQIESIINTAVSNQLISSQSSSHYHINTNLSSLLNKIDSTAETIFVNKPVFNIANGEHSNKNIVLLKRQGHNKVLIQDTNIQTNVNNDEIQMFIKNMEDQNCPGIFLSHKSGFSYKPNYHIEVHNRLVMVFVHYVDYNTDKIKIALDIVDHFSARIRELGYFNNNIDIVIQKEVLDEINKEYQLFMNQKENLIQCMKENSKKMISQLEEFSMNSLDKYLSTHYSVSMTKICHKCDLCKNFNAHNLKALAAHKRGCIRKNKVALMDVTNILAV
jgi:hypothetical protein